MYGLHPLCAVTTTSPKILCCFSLTVMKHLAHALHPGADDENDQTKLIQRTRSVHQHLVPPFHLVRGVLPPRQVYLSDFRLSDIAHALPHPAKLSSLYERIPLKHISHCCICID